MLVEWVCSTGSLLAAVQPTRIEAPGDGTVGERQVRPGLLVSPGTQAIPFVDRIKWVQANYRETQLTNMKVGDPAEIRVDEYPEKSSAAK